MESENVTEINSSNSSQSNKTNNKNQNKQNKLKPLNLASININSIRGKRLEVSSLIENENIDVICFQETKLDSSIYSSEIFENSFTNYRKNRNCHPSCF